jgi:hypothetical protein
MKSNYWTHDEFMLNPCIEFYYPKIMNNYNSNFKNISPSYPQQIVCLMNLAKQGISLKHHI